MKFLRRHFTWKNFLLEHDNPERFAHGPWSKNGRVSVFFLIYRMALPLILLGILSWSWNDSWYSGKWWIYLTRWGFLLLWLQTFIAAIIVSKAYRNQRKLSNDNSTEDPLNNTRMPLIYKIYWVLYNMAIPISLFITVLYWSVLYDPNSESSTGALSYIMHAGNAVVALIDLFFGGPPSNLLHALQPIGFGLLYLIFNVVYWAAGGTDPKGNPWIYPVLNWSENPSRAAILIVVSSLLLLAVHVLVVIIAGLRNSLLRRLKPSDIQTKTQTPSTTDGNINKAFVIDVDYKYLR